MEAIGNVGAIGGSIPRILPAIGAGPDAVAPDAASARGSFAATLDSALGSLLDAQRGAEKATLELAAGRSENLHEVMLAVNQAGLAMQLALEVRNHLVDAYHEVMRMTV
ncbi:MAG TPA: flagellar hook-basal body complex protein FliE [Planctomycetota bacterium]|nr:flagellar hook-basal body complex protein FliE [Planctomycetota bacterium]